MTWYAAHLIQYFTYLDGKPDTYLVWENVVLIEADSWDDAFKEAEKKGKEDYEVPDDSATLNDRPAKSVFGGVRKLVECQDIEQDFPITQPGHGTEVTYSEFQVEGEFALERLISGRSVMVMYEE